MTLNQFLKETNITEDKIINYSGAEALEKVKQNGIILQYVHEQTEEICLTAVKQDGLALQYVHDQTEEICLASVKQDAYALRYVKEQTEKICLAAVKQNENVSQFVDKSIFEEEFTEYTIKELESLLGKKIKIKGN